MGKCIGNFHTLGALPAPFIPVAQLPLGPAGTGGYQWTAGVRHQLGSEVLQPTAGVISGGVGLGVMFNLNRSKKHLLCLGLEPNQI